jgi:two-component system, cell cycle sensor histidine kinase and response regulator CckA
MRNPSTDLNPATLGITLINEVHDAVIVSDLDGRIRLWNKGAERIYGWRAAEITGRNAYEVLFPTNTDDLEECTQVVAKTGKWAGELRQLTKDRRPLVVESRWRLHRNASFLETSVLMINRDITEKKSLEEKMVVAQRIETVGRLATSIAHDLNNILSTMLIAIRALPQEAMDEKPKRFIKSSEFCAEHATELITQLLSIAKDIDAEPTRIHLVELISETARLLRSTFPESIAIEIVTPPDLWPIAGNTTHLYQLLLNLCSNARDAMPSGGTLTIDARNVVLDEAAARRLPQGVAGAYVLLSVTDTGTGIPTEITGQIFEPFFTTKQRGGSSGLGLFTVANIVKNHNGFIDVATRSKSGTQFMVYLPVEKRYF